MTSEELQGTAPEETIGDAVDIEEEMKRSYLDYSMSVIVSRALPDVRDGLKPVHRRILYSMYEQRLTQRRPYKKSATVVGDVLGKYHPHGDSAVYDAMVRMAQEFSLRDPLVDGQGNFGSVDGDPAAAYRYTEARMSRVGEAMLTDIDMETVDFVPNFDQRLKEPVVLPSRFPCMLVNGSAGIAVGMATNIPPHNLSEIVEACRRLIEDPELPDSELIGIVRGPDFPTGGIVTGTYGVHAAYLEGKGHIRVRGRVETEEVREGREAIIITEIPYQVNKSRLIEAIADLVKQKKITGIADLRDESDREGMRIVVEIKRDSMSDVVLNQLYKHTDLTRTFGANMLALVDGRPERLTLREFLGYFLEHRHEVVLRRSRYLLRKAEDRRHIVEGLLRAQDVIDEVIAVIRGSDSPEEAAAELMGRFAFSERQAGAILEMRLRRLTGLEREELVREFDELTATIGELRELVADRASRMHVVSEELREIAEAFGTPRRTEIQEYDPDELEMEDLIPDDTMVVTVSREGYVKRLPVRTYRSQRRGGKGITGARPKEDDCIDQVFVTTNHSYILFFTDGGRCYWLKVYRIPKAGRTSRGKAIVNLLQLDPDERPVAHVCVKEFPEDRYVLMATSDGRIKKTPLSSYGHPRRGGILAVRLEEGAELIDASVTDGDSEVLLALRSGKANRFSEEEVRPMGRYTRGVTGIRVERGDRVVGMVVASEDESILTVTERGYGKRTQLSRYRLTHRASGGVINIQNLERNGPVIGVRRVAEDDELIMMSAGGMVIRVPVADIRETRRSTMGVRLMGLPDDDSLVDVAVLRACDAEEEPEEEPEEERQAEEDAEDRI